MLSVIVGGRGCDNLKLDRSYIDMHFVLFGGIKNTGKFWHQLPPSPMMQTVIVSMLMATNDQIHHVAHQWILANFQGLGAPTARALSRPNPHELEGTLFPHIVFIYLFNNAHHD